MSRKNTKIYRYGVSISEKLKTISAMLTAGGYISKIQKLDLDLGTLYDCAVILTKKLGLHDGWEPAIFCLLYYPNIDSDKIGVPFTEVFGIKDTKSDYRNTYYAIIFSPETTEVALYGKYLGIKKKGYRPEQLKKGVKKDAELIHKYGDENSPKKMIVVYPRSSWRSVLKKYREAQKIFVALGLKKRQGVKKGKYTWEKVLFASLKKLNKNDRDVLNTYLSQNGSRLKTVKLENYVRCGKKKMAKFGLKLKE